NTLGLHAVAGSGESFRCGTYTSKGATGYDLTRLLIGSEGTLALITEATLKLTPKPSGLRTLRATYRDVGSAARAVSRIMAQPVTPCALEFIDDVALKLAHDHGGNDVPLAGAMLMIEVEGGEDSIVEACRNNGLIKAERMPDPSGLWAARRALSPLLRDIAPKKINEDIVVPVSRLPELLAGLGRLSSEYGIANVNFGHAGNGNIHVNLLVDPENAAEMGRAEVCLEKVFDLVLSMKGTLSGEHGVGREKMPYVPKEIDEKTIGLMKAIKSVFDPKGILNPGKLFP
ncbi:MAG TPA: FAD-linked oxidase C-terminal domain-containing protein, partial [Burkholderiales bacterium]|nr:FAD-linked oxidase C-terminal domain-containing protein [Burkholderiales bacterium]